MMAVAGTPAQDGSGHHGSHSHQTGHSQQDHRQTECCDRCAAHCSAHLGILRGGAPPRTAKFVAVAGLEVECGWVPRFWMSGTVRYIF